MEKKKEVKSASLKIKKYVGHLSKHATLSSNEVINTLLKLREHSKNKSGILAINSENGITHFLNLLQRPNKKIIDITSSIVANCLTENEIREKVLNLKGIPIIVRVLQSIHEGGVITRTCRSIANLATNSTCAIILHEECNMIHILTRIIKKQDYPPVCISSALRALRHLADTSKHRKAIINQGTVAVVSKCLFSTDMDVSSSAVRMLSTVSRTCTLNFADQLLGKDIAAVKQLVTMVNQSESQTVKDEALKVLVNLTRQSCARPAIGNAEGIPCFLAKIKEFLNGKDNHDASRYIPVISAVCYCCRDAGNRIKLQDNNAFPTLIEVLREEKWSPIHPFMITSLAYFVYFEEGLIALHDNGLFSVLISHLQKCHNHIKKATTSTSSSILLSPAHPTQRRIWDGHHTEIGDEVDMRHSMSYDVSTKFNKRPSTTADIGTAIDNEVDAWQSMRDYEEPMSPQWSPICGSIATKFKISSATLAELEAEVAAADEDASLVKNQDVHDEPLSELLTSVMFEQPSVKRLRENASGNSEDCKRRKSDQGHFSRERDKFREDITSTSCSRSFLEFVYDTCDLSSDIPTSTSTEIKFTRKKKIEETKSNAKNETEEQQINPNDPTCLRRSLTEPGLTMPVESNNSECFRLDIIIMFLLCHYCEMSDQCVVSLANNDAFANVFYEYVRATPGVYTSKLVRILERLTLPPEAFICIVNTLLVPSVCCAFVQRAFVFPDDNVQNHSCPYKCGSLVAESSYIEIVDRVMRNFTVAQCSKYGSGELRKSLMHDNCEIKARAAISIITALNWTSKARANPLSDYLIEGTHANALCVSKHNSLNDVLLLMKDDSLNDNLLDTYMYVLTTLHQQHCGNIDIFAKDATKYQKLDSTSVNNCTYELKLKSSNHDKVLVCAQSGKEIKVHCDIITEKSEVLRAMLQGNFKESTDKCVTINNISFDALMYIVHHLYGCSEEKCKQVQSLQEKMFTNDSYSTLLASEYDSNPFPLELCIVELSHMWCIDNIAKSFVEKNLSHFRHKYIAKELKNANLNKNHQGNTQISQGNSFDVSFFNFISKYSLNHLRECYLFSMFNTCTYDHDIRAQSTVFQKFLSNPTIYEEIAIYVKNLLLIVTQNKN